ncbi:class I SAM-dependent methyltransferase [Polynucleobacter sp. AP-Sving-400A-A2]|uniref:class I SAM-dependent methyltransferase n=1 Tax=Polynucleobacter sp. AP-Sving-400A-A2 TaxID=2081049 RepID=UPI001BFEBBEF|nr:class I SAM-dependent methyltransferase [Polynucleobacter sp. AP-Sving-400A-A2]QWE14245.1 class I SAM-dependent methyltransferase [Polynucleobacter sp. AP-Sving-400A-A2]
MTSFSTDWLSLRESADHRSRNPVLQEQVLRYLEKISNLKNGPIHIVDLGSGTGSNLRALAPLIHHNQNWTLIDYDPLLLTAAREKICIWADYITDKAHNKDHDNDVTRPVTLVKNNYEITVQFLQKDLASNLQSKLFESADLITAAAFFDLIALDWLVQFCSVLKTSIYTVLTYNGEETWLPSDPRDTEILEAFHHHQGSDKGFGNALGPLAFKTMEQLLKKEGFHVETGSSPWILNPNDASLIQELAAGTAKAVVETHLVSHEIAKQWGEQRSKSQHCEIGHDDLFAIYKKNSI